MDLGITILANFYPLSPFPASESTLERFMRRGLMPRSHPKANPYQNILTETWKTQKPPADPRVGWMDQLACMRLAWGHDSAESLE